MNTEAGNNFRHSGSVNVCPLVLWFFRLTAFNSVEQFSLSADWSSPGRHGNVSWTEPRAWRTASCQIIVFKFNNQTSHHRWGFYISVKDWCSVTWLNKTWNVLVNRRAFVNFVSDILYNTFLFWWVVDHFCQWFADFVVLLDSLMIWWMLYWFFCFNPVFGDVNSAPCWSWPVWIYGFVWYVWDGHHHAVKISLVSVEDECWH